MPHQMRSRILLAATVSLFAASLPSVSRAERAPQSAQAEKPIEQTRKNIQVLKGLKESELYQLMNFMSVSIGQQCTFCHVTNGKDPKTGQTNWVWESDEKPEKQAGRRMIQLVMTV